MKKFLLLAVLFLGLKVYSQEVHLYSAQILEVKEKFDMKSVSSGTYSVYKRVFVTKESADLERAVTIFTDGDRYLSSFSGTVTNSSGKVIKKLKKQDLEQRALAQELADDSYIYYYQVEAPYPFILEYEYEVTYRRGVLSFPAFIPVNAPDVIVSKGEYSVSVPSGTPIQYSSNLEVEIKKDGNADIYTWRCDGYGGYTREDYMPSQIELVPNVFAAPKNFMFSKVAGQQGSWKDIGSWLYDLQKDTWDLSDQDKAKVLAMTSGSKNTFEKVKVLYDYLRQTTRYVSIQLGIGGYKPFPASTVSRTGFGDCKALSNYLKAMLEVAGVESFYYIANTRRAELMPNYSSVGQMNHAMLAVPLNDGGILRGDTLWVECTNPALPLGYRHEDIAGHQVVFIKEDGGQVVHCPIYPDSASRMVNNVRVLMSSTGEADISVRHNRYLDFAEGWLSFKSLSLKEQTDKLSADVIVAANGLKIEGVSDNFEDYPKYGRNYIPGMSISYSFKCRNYAEASSGRLFVPITCLRRGFSWQRGERKNDVWIRTNRSYIDSVSVLVPPTYELEGLPKSVNVDSRIASFTSSFKQVNNEVKVVLCCSFKAGKYPKDSYKEYAEAVRRFNRMCDSKIVFRKKQD